MENFVYCLDIINKVILISNDLINYKLKRTEWFNNVLSFFVEKSGDSNKVLAHTDI